jgi:hypothetical protein
VQFRFRFGSDNHAFAHDSIWRIDAIKVQGCSDAAGDRIFTDGFDGTP